MPGGKRPGQSLTGTMCLGQALLDSPEPLSLDLMRTLTDAVD
jgi:hypothetical protein